MSGSGTDGVAGMNGSAGRNGKPVQVYRVPDYRADSSEAVATKELREQIAEERAELEETITALVAKADVKNQTQAKAAAVRERVVGRVGAVVRPVAGSAARVAVFAAVMAGMAMAGVVAVWRRRK